MVVKMKSKRNCGDYDSHLVAVPVPGVDTAVLVVKLHGAGDCLAESETCNTKVETTAVRTRAFKLFQANYLLENLIKELYFSAHGRKYSSFIILLSSSMTRNLSDSCQP